MLNRKDNLSSKNLNYNKYSNNFNSSNSSKSLSEIFKEVQDIRFGRIKPEEIKTEISKENIKFNKIYVSNHKFNAAGAIIGVLFLILFATSIHSNYIFATSEEEKKAVNSFEENNSKLNIMNIISNNISEYTTKEILTKEIQVEYETEYIDNNSMPKGEEKVIQAGKFGQVDQTVIKTYENNELISESVISEILKAEPTKQIVERGTSEFLFNKKVHIGDTVYTTEKIILYEEPSEDSNAICYVHQYIDVKLLSEGNGWCFIKVDGIDGYIRGDYITSSNLNPDIVELSRKKRIEISFKFDMSLNKPSGLTRNDFVKVLSGHSEDTEKIFEQNAGLFYDIEQKYNVNGIFLASMGIHESNWGKSNIAKQKKNLFGYGSYDSSAFESSYTFESYQYGIELVAKVLAKYYLNEPGTIIYDGETAVGSYYNGPTVSGVNTRYASDQNWANKVFATMEKLYNKI